VGLRCVDDDKLRCDAAGLIEESLPVAFLEMTVEMRAEDAVERSVVEGEDGAITLHEPDPRRLLGGNVEHRAALIQSDDFSAEMTGQKAGATGDVERASGREALDRPAQLCELVVPARPVAVGEAATSEPPVVVLARPRFVVRLHGSLE
jgi:hypothetical protein